jgi:hypothetical protein
MRQAAVHVVLGFWLVATAQAQWTVVNLHPAGATGNSSAAGVDGAQQVGSARVGANDHASLWTGTAASWVDLHPPTALASSARDVSGGKQVGWIVTEAGAVGARLWSGTAGSAVNLAPAGSMESQARGGGAGAQAGWARLAGVDQAGWWKDTSASWINLHPTALTPIISIGYDAEGGQQVGAAHFDFPGGAFSRAALWTGTAASFVNLHPAVSPQASGSEALGVQGGRQVGYASVGCATCSHASLWSGTAASWVDLHPLGATTSRATAVYNSRQVGFVVIGASNRASLWSGTAASWVNLHAFLPANFTSSSAAGIWHDANSTRIVGSGFNSTTMRTEALMWIGPGACAADLDHDGDIDQSDLGIVLASYLVGGGGDIDGDGDTDQSDLGLLLAKYGTMCL